jgi:hypothetical protein
MQFIQKDFVHRKTLFSPQGRTFSEHKIRLLFIYLLLFIKFPLIPEGYHTKQEAKQALHFFIKAH